MYSINYLCWTCDQDVSGQNDQKSNVGNGEDEGRWVQSGLLNSERIGLSAGGNKNTQSNTTELVDENVQERDKETPTWETKDEDTENLRGRSGRKGGRGLRGEKKGAMTELPRGLTRGRNETRR